MKTIRNLLKTRPFTTLLLLALPAAVQAQFQYSDNGDGTCSITRYTGQGGAVDIPPTIANLAVTSIGVAAFDGTSLTTVTIPDGVTGIEASAFQDCARLVSVNLPNSVTTIGDSAFASCTSLTSVTIPQSVMAIGAGLQGVYDFVFVGDSSMTNFMVAAANPNYASVSGVLFNKNLTTLIQYPGALKGSYVIPNSVTSIGDGAFSSSDLNSITIPNSVTSIGFYTFSGCPNLTTVFFEGNAPQSGGTTGLSFDNGLSVIYYLPGATGWNSTFDGVPAVLWNPQAVAPGVSGGHFGFNITGPTNAVIVVEASTNLANPLWIPVSTNTLSASGTSSFNDSQSKNYPARYYRFRSE